MNYMQQIYEDRKVHGRYRLRAVTTCIFLCVGIVSNVFAGAAAVGSADGSVGASNQLTTAVNNQIPTIVSASALEQNSQKEKTATQLASKEFAAVEEVEFDPQMLIRPDGVNIDVSRFSKANPIAPGEYTVDLYLNGESLDHLKMQFVATNEPRGAVPCFTGAVVERINFNETELSEEGRAELSKARNGSCIDIRQVVKNAFVKFDYSIFRLDVSIPQAALLRNPRGYINPALWDEGVNSATLAYRFNTFDSSAGGENRRQNLLMLNGGINLAGWHLRHSGSLSGTNNALEKYQATSTYLQHDLPAWKSQLMIGEVFTDGQLFDSIGIRGIQVGTDDRMTPESLRGYAPVIRGNAKTNARVTITQNGTLLQETVVPPGEFEFNDLYPTGYGGDLIVTVHEADGTEHSMTIPYAATPQLLRVGNSRFNVAVGQVRDTLSSGMRPGILQATLQRGLNNTFTGYIGLLASSSNYVSGQVGVAASTPLGAIGADVTYAHTDFADASTKDGYSARLSYSKLFVATKTNFSLAAYRYSSGGYLDLHNALQAQDNVVNGLGALTNIRRPRNQLQLTFNQALSEKIGGGSLSVSGSTQQYWDGTASTQYNIGYGNSWRKLNYGITASRQKDGAGKFVNQLMVSTSIPLGPIEHSMMLSNNFMQTSQHASLQTTLTGSIDEKKYWNFGLSSLQSQGTGAYSANIGYTGRYATMNASVGQGSGYTQSAVSISGAVVAHPGGVTLANNLGDTIAVVEAHGAEGAQIINGQNAAIDSRGYAVVSYLSPYNLNNIGIDTKGLPLDVELNETAQKVAPHLNSVVMVKFKANEERAVLFDMSLNDGSVPPFGASVLNEKGENLATVGQDGRVFLRGVAAVGTLNIRWGETSTESCVIEYQLPPKEQRQNRRYDRVEAMCVAGSSVKQDPILPVSFLDNPTNLDAQVLASNALSANTMATLNR